jgi:hypothetical protein
LIVCRLPAVHRNSTDSSCIFTNLTMKWNCQVEKSVSNSIFISSSQLAGKITQKRQRCRASSPSSDRSQLLGTPPSLTLISSFSHWTSVATRPVTKNGQDYSGGWRIFQWSTWLKFLMRGFICQTSRRFFEERHWKLTEDLISAFKTNFSPNPGAPPTSRAVPSQLRLWRKVQLQGLQGTDNRTDRFSRIEIFTLLDQKVLHGNPIRRDVKFEGSVIWRHLNSSEFFRI